MPLLILALLILACGFFALAEMAFAASRKSRLQQMACEMLSARTLHCSRKVRKNVSQFSMSASLKRENQLGHFAERCERLLP
jgi:CBS domain containing-hemolysin-like protein